MKLFSTALKALFFGVLFFTASLSFSQSGNSLLWKVEGKKLQQPSYLFGTMHVSDSLIHSLVSDSLERVIGSVDVFLSELSFADVQNMDQSKMLNAMMMPPDTSLRDFFTEEEFEKMNDFFAQNLGIGAMMVPRMKPFYTLATLQQLQMMGDSAMAVEMANAGEKPVLDNLLSNIADSLGLELIGLETIDEQLGAIDQIPLQKQAESLKYYIDNYDERDDDASEMYQAYANQNIKRILEFVNEDNKDFELIEEPLIIERNKNMHQRLLKYLNRGEAVFCAVGLLHLIGETGLILELREDGYTVEPIGF
ncbi:TraB/GumN family protein [Halocola ammonii]